MDDDINVSFRLEDAVALKLAMFAHEARITMNELLVQVLATTAEGWKLQLRPTSSRNAREGNYTGAHRGRHLRTTRRAYYCGAPYADVAWALASQRAGQPLPARAALAARRPAAALARRTAAASAPPALRGEGRTR